MKRVVGIIAEIYYDDFFHCAKYNCVVGEEENQLSEL